MEEGRREMIRQITRDELMSMCRSGEKFILVDVLSSDSYEKEHIAGAISIALADLEKKAESLLKKDDNIVVYCASFECSASTKAAEKLTAMGYKNVLDYKGGLKDYKEAGLALEGSLHIYRGCGSCCACR